VRRRRGAWDALLDGLGFVVAVLTAAMTLAVVYEVVARYFFNRPTSWAVDFTEYALLYVTFLGAAWALREQAHIRIEILTERLGLRPQRSLAVAVALLGAGVSAVLLWQGAEVTWEAWAGGQAMLKAWRVPRWILILPIAVGGLLLTVEFLRQAWDGTRELRRRDRSP
jgi:TRAP-type C4-dicarboxylate transport system permease small subunit